MKIKRFEAASMAEALRMVKKEFGEEAVILSAKTASKAGRLFGARQAGQVVVTAAIDPLAVKQVPNASAEQTPALADPSDTPEKTPSAPRAWATYCAVFHRSAAPDSRNCNPSLSA
jgi:flagellar biosynthesis GTPase FlhF